MTTAAPELQLVPIDEISPHPDNPRREVGDVEGLAASIKAVGILQALVVHQNDDGSITCLLGHRRRLAGKLADLTHVPASVWTGLAPDEQLEIMMIENVQRKDLSPVEEASAFDSLIKTGKSQRVVAERMGCDQSHVSRRLELLKLSPGDQDRVHEGKLTVSKALKSLKPKKEKLPKVEVGLATLTATMLPDPIDAMEPIGYKVIEIGGDGEYADNWSADIFSDPEAARTEVATTTFEGEPRALIAVALVPLPPTISTEASATDVNADEASPSDEVGSVAGGEEEGLAVPVSESKSADAGPPAPAPEELTEERKRALVHFAKTWGEIKAADEETVRESAEHEFFDSPGDAERAVKLWQTAREQLHKVAS